MIPDNNLILSSAQAITTTAVSTSVVDQGAAADAYDGQLFAEFIINTAFTSNGATVQFELQTATDAAFTTPVTLGITPALAVATLTAGVRPPGARFRIPPGALRFLRANYTVASGPAAAGKVDCRLVADIEILNP